MSMGQKKFRIGDLAEQLKIKKFVIRFWEREFELKSDRSSGGQRFYTQDDFNTFSLIKELLYQKKFTIPGAKEELTKLKKNLKPATTQAFQEKTNTEIPNDFLNKLTILKKQLLKLQKQL